MVEVLLHNLASHLDEATVRNWFYEEGDSVQEGDDLVELSTEDGTLTVQAPASGVLAEVYYDEGEVVARDEVLCSIDDSDPEIDEAGGDEA
ncbi:MAG: lipoyl domain-containing protein [Candidatus Omnitrophica bacterium]|nr:lipoyl domain-containing protein [Candidatus Omnitrophota bacterium]